jgi:selT/selW/selH selenoprotein domain
MADNKPEIVITYCTQCQWLLRAAWLAQELLSTFSDELARVALEPATGGTFRITCDGVQIWERKADGGFPGGQGAEAAGTRPDRSAARPGAQRPLMFRRCLA